jgi:hypothetical protein
VLSLLTQRRGCVRVTGAHAVQVRRPQLHWDAPSINVSLLSLKRARVSSTSKTHAHAASADGGGIRQEGLKHVLQEMRASISALNHRLDSLGRVMELPAERDGAPCRGRSHV